MKKLNLGCEKEYKEGWINVDFDKRVKADVYLDLNKYPYPFQDNEFDIILASSVLKHLNDFYKAVEEIYRIGKQGCKVYIHLPHASEITVTYGEVEHKREFSINTFGSIWCNKEYWYKFKVLKRRVSFTRVNFTFMNYIINPIVNLFPRVWERCFSHIIPCGVLVYILKIRKDKEFQEAKKRTRRI